MKTIWTNDIEEVLNDSSDADYEEYVSECEANGEEPDDQRTWDTDTWEDRLYVADDWVNEDLVNGVLPMVFENVGDGGIIGISLRSRWDAFYVWGCADNMAYYIDYIRRDSGTYSSITEYNGELMLNDYNLYTFPESTRHMYKFIKKFTSYLDEDIGYEQYRRDGESNREFAVRSYLDDMGADDNYYITATPKELMDSGLLIPIRSWY